MKTVRQLVHREVFQAVIFVALGFLSLFLFFDLADEMQYVNRLAAQGYNMTYALLVVAARAPGHLYDLMPIAVLIGTIFVMARLAQSSEFTILRTGGLGPGRALWLLLQAGWVFVAFTYVLGDYVAPWADQQGILLKSRFSGKLTTGRTGAWLKEKQGDEQVAVNIRAMDDQARMIDIRIHRFDAQGGLISTLHARQGVFGEQSWRLHQVESIEVPAQAQHSALSTRTLEQLDWPTGITRDMVGAALISADRMRIWDLIVYTRHLSQNQQNPQEYEIQLWRKVFYPLSCMVMLTLALPFAYLHFRSGQIATHVFGGVMAGISFYLLNNLFSHVGNLRDWEPWIASAAPSLIYTLISLAAFGWMVLRR